MKCALTNLTKLGEIEVIHIMIYSRSQRANNFQVTRALQELGISDRGLTSLRNLGVAAHPGTVNSASQSSAQLHLSSVASFFRGLAVKNQHFLVFCMNNYHIIHIKHHPEQKT